MTQLVSSFQSKRCPGFPPLPLTTPWGAFLWPTPWGAARCTPLLLSPFPFSLQFSRLSQLLALPVLWALLSQGFLASRSALPFPLNDQSPVCAPLPLLTGGSCSSTPPQLRPPHCKFPMFLSFSNVALWFHMHCYLISISLAGSPLRVHRSLCSKTRCLSRRSSGHGKQDSQLCSVLLVKYNEIKSLLPFLLSPKMGEIFPNVLFH